MATRWPTEILKVGMAQRPVWGRVYGVREEGDVEDDFLSSDRTTTARADIRGGTANVGECLLDASGQLWVVVGVDTAPSYYGGGQILELQQGITGQID